MGRPSRATTAVDYDLALTGDGALTSGGKKEVTWRNDKEKIESVSPVVLNQEIEFLDDISDGDGSNFQLLAI